MKPIAYLDGEPLIDRSRQGVTLARRQTQLHLDIPTGTKIIVRARTGEKGCTGVAYNKACKLIQEAGLAERFSPGSWPVTTMDLSGNPDQYWCIRVRHADANGIDLRLLRWKDVALRKLRERYREAVDVGGFEPIRVGDVAGLQVDSSGDAPVVVVLMLVGRQAVLFVTGGGRSEGIDVARSLARVM